MSQVRKVGGGGVPLVAPPLWKVRRQMSPLSPHLPPVLLPLAGTIFTGYKPVLWALRYATVFVSGFIRMKPTSRCMGFLPDSS